MKKTLVSVLIILSLVMSTVTSFAGVTPAMQPLNWATETVVLMADDFYVTVDGKKFVPDQIIRLVSDPGEMESTTLEATWLQDGIEMRVNLYFASDAKNWWVYESRVYNGKEKDVDWITLEKSLFKTAIGKDYSKKGTTTITIAKNASITISNLKLEYRTEVERLQYQLQQSKNEFESYKVMHYYVDSAQYHTSVMEGYQSSSSFMTGSEQLTDADGYLNITPNFSGMASTKFPAYAKCVIEFKVRLVVPENFYGIIRGYKDGVKTYELVKPGTHEFLLEGITMIIPSTEVEYMYNSYMPTPWSKEAAQYIIKPLPEGVSFYLWTNGIVTN